MKSLRLFASLATLAALVSAAYILGKYSHKKIDYFHIYVFSGYNDSRRNAQLEVIDRYFKQTSNHIEHYKLHLTYDSTAQTTTSLLQHLRGSQHLEAEGPLFVTLDLPTARSKMALRASVENVSELRGERRSLALRSIVPVLTLQSQGEIDLCRQLDDDIIYAKDNYGGIAFMVDERGRDVLKECTKPAP